MGIRYSKEDTGDDSSANVLNKILFPAVSPNIGTNPAFSTFTFDTSSKTASNLKSSYIKLVETFDKSATTSHAELPFFDVDF